jgi:hypothetical protein
VRPFFLAHYGPACRRIVALDDASDHDPTATPSGDRVTGAEFYVTTKSKQGLQPREVRFR